MIASFAPHGPAPDADKRRAAASFAMPYNQRPLAYKAGFAIRG